MRRSATALRVALAHEFTLTESPACKAGRYEGLCRALSLACITRAEGRAADLTWINMSKLVTPKIRNCKLSEQVVEDRGGVLDGLIPAHRTCRFEACEGEGI